MSVRVTLPSLSAPFVNSNGGIVTPWNFFLQALTAAPAAIVGIPVGSSPQSYTAPNDGQLAITGGTVTGVQIQRGGVTLNVGIPSLIGVSQNDTVIVTFSAAPTLSFIPG